MFIFKTSNSSSVMLIYKYLFIIPSQGAAWDGINWENKIFEKRFIFVSFVYQAIFGYIDEKKVNFEHKRKYFPVLIQVTSKKIFLKKFFLIRIKISSRILNTILFKQKLVKILIKAISFLEILI